MAKSFGVSQNDYLKFKNYQNRKKHNPRFNLPNILDTLNDKLFTDKDPIHHYNTKYGAVPPWILFKSVFFSTMVNFIDLFKAKEKIELVNLLYDKNKINLSEDKLCKLMMDTLYICLDYRNVSAHGGRTYNHISNNSLRFEEIFGHHSDAPYGFSELLFLLELLNYDRPAKVLRNTLEREISRHCNSYPQDITYLGQILNINIVPRDMVYISKKSGKYHFVPHCSGLSKTIQMEMDEAIKNGYVPCKRCTQQ